MFVLKIYLNVVNIGHLASREGSAWDAGQNASNMGCGTKCLKYWTSCVIWDGWLPCLYIVVMMEFSFHLHVPDLTNHYSHHLNFFNIHDTSCIFQHNIKLDDDYLLTSLNSKRLAEKWSTPNSIAMT